MLFLSFYDELFILLSNMAMGPIDSIVTGCVAAFAASSLAYPLAYAPELGVTQAPLLSSSLRSEVPANSVVRFAIASCDSLALA